jgi:hypothetical protein
MVARDYKYLHCLPKQHHSANGVLVLIASRRLLPRKLLPRRLLPRRLSPRRLSPGGLVPGRLIREQVIDVTDHVFSSIIAHMDPWVCDGGQPAWNICSGSRRVPSQPSA